jgi:hypothetical protein
VDRQQLAGYGDAQKLGRLPALYQRVRLGDIEEMRKRDATEYERRLANFVAKSGKGEMFGNWDDLGLPRSEV